VAIRSRTRSTRSLVIVLVTASLITITVDYREGGSGPLAGLGRAALSVISPLQEVAAGVFRPIGNFFSALSHLPSQRARIEELERELDAARSGTVRVAELERELAQLQAILELTESLPLNLDVTGARVIANGVSNFEWTVTIDKGSGDGIREDMPVVTGAGLVGHVVRVAAGASDVLLIIDPRSQVAGRFVSSGKTGLLQGQGGEDLRMELVLPETPVEPEDVVVTAGYEGGLYPPGIPIGVVSRLVPDPTALDRYVRVRPYVDFSSLDFVAVVLVPETE
jgi:rod shape-determining protein MreC